MSGENLAIVVVGDWSGTIPIPAETADGRPRPVSVTIGEQVEALQLGTVVLLSEDGTPVPSEEVE